MRLPIFLSLQCAHSKKLGNQKKRDAPGLPLPHSSPLLEDTQRKKTSKPRVFFELQQYETGPYCT